MKKIHPTQKKLLSLLKKYIDDPLTIRGLQDELGLSSPSVVFHHIKQLEKLGYLRRNPSNPQDYQILADEPEKKITYLNVYGSAQCGAKGSLLDGNPISRIPIATQILGFSASEAFMVKARGNSMAPQINHGDYVIAQKKSKASNGNLIVCQNNGEILIKRVKKSNGGFILSSANPKYEPFFSADDFRIFGIVRGILTYPKI